MCDCIRKIEERLKPEIHCQFGSDKAPVKHFNIRVGATGRALINIYVDTRRTMKPKETFIVADYCPWCGVKYAD